MIDTESLVPQEHLLRKVDGAVDFEKLYEIVEPLYSEDAGRPSVDPVALSQAAVFIDGTHIKASANLNKKIKQEVPVAAKRYREDLLAEINADREAHGKKPFDDDEPPKPGWKKRDNTSKKKLARRKKQANSGEIR